MPKTTPLTRYPPTLLHPASKPTKLSYHKVFVPHGHVPFPHSLFHRCRQLTYKLQLYALYLDPLNTTLLKTLYLPPSPVLQLPSLHTLRNAATAEILKTTRTAVISPLQLLSDATDALRSLSALLSADEWFFGRSEPGLFDAEVFAYTYLILDEDFGWADDSSLARCLTKFSNLVEHRRRLYERCWPETRGEK
jgi:metaxin